MTIDDIRDMLKSFGINNDNLAVFLSVRLFQEWCEGFKVCGATMTGKPVAEIEKKMNEFLAMKRER